MKKKIIIVVYVILIIVTLKLVYNIFVNNKLINQYEKGKYLEEQAQILTSFNFPQSYVANYNYGNVLYKNGEYEEAIEEYKKALKGRPPKKKECSIRINYALAICKTVELDEQSQSSIQEAIEKYESAIDILTEKGCANKNDNKGHSKEAEQLKMDIQDEIDRLKRLQNSEQGKDGQNKEEENKNEKENEKTIEEKIKDIKEEATKEQRDTESQFKYGSSDYDTSRKNW